MKYAGLNFAHFYPRSPCGERRHQGRQNPKRADISIHALLAESDTKPTGQHQVYPHFYPRSPCGERQARRDSRQQPAGISIHALLAESDTPVESKRRNSTISIHALLAESDVHCVCAALAAEEFLSTLSLRRATRLGLLGWLRVLISIHALLAESDVAQGADFGY